MHDISKLVGNYEELIDLAIRNLSGVGIDINSRQIDHLAFRAQNLEEYHQLKKSIIDNDLGFLLNEAEIRERLVCIIRLKQPIQYKAFEIPCFEILAPAKEDRVFKRKLEHIEVVINEVPLTEFMKNYPHVEFNTKNLSRKDNPELILNFSNDANVKFHPLSIQQVIN